MSPSDRLTTPQHQEGAQQQLAGAQDQAKPGTVVPNPAEPYAPSKIPERATAESFVKRAGQGGPVPTEYPKLRYHPVHGGVIVKDAKEAAALQPPTDWFDSAELADAARTWTEAEIVRQHNLREKLRELDDAKHPIVRNSAQADEALRRGQPEPL